MYSYLSTLIEPRSVEFLARIKLEQLLYMFLNCVIFCFQFDVLEQHILIGCARLTKWFPSWYIYTEDAIQAKNVFLAIMSHEIRTPLNGLLGLAEALEASELRAEQRELVRTILSSSVMIADILGDILDLATMEFGEINFLFVSDINFNF